MDMQFGIKCSKWSSLMQLLWRVKIHQNQFIGTVMGIFVAYGMGNELKNTSFKK
jgi:hypothetical protein